ncbi:hypothetical protein [Chryseobacterium sp. 2VB]|uniref:hypothetical protein n=1 Tax=Chryseobacterium sp. 2VB TaxID=2502204 RepID=UPI0010F77ADB|nr:hypothetical protein [Chryseobacterium sp. 2VB]
MILTGKAKEDFRIWLQEYSKDFELIELFDKLHTASQNGLIIEWLDEKRIYIETMKAGFYRCNINDNATGDLFIVKNQNTRNEAQRLAIEKANEIYNTTH